jgi:hypothetical protein
MNTYYGTIVYSKNVYLEAGLDLVLDHLRYANKQDQTCSQRRLASGSLLYHNKQFTNQN